MRLLLDTHTALWWWEDSPALGERAREAMMNPANEIFFSAASAYEILLKNRLGKLELPAALIGDSLAKAVIDEGWQFLPLSVPQASRAASLDHPHRDPFDRMLAAQSQLGPFTLATRDPFFAELDLDLIW
jgi:PIN domain nuclease of toxin-antitoxin system